MTILDSHLAGDAGPAAIVNNGYLFARNITTDGFGAAIRDHGEEIPGPIDEHVHGEVLGRSEGTVSSLDLGTGTPPETPDVPWDVPENWVCVCDFGYTPGSASNPNYADAGPALRAALAFMNRPENAAKTTLYFSRGDYRLETPVTISGNVRRVIGNFATIWTKKSLEVGAEPVFTLAATDHEVLVLERLNFAPQGYRGSDRRRKVPIFRNDSPRDVVIRNVYIGHGPAYRTGSAAGRLFLEDVAALSHRYYSPDEVREVLYPEAEPQFDFGAQEVWARQLNPEQQGTKLATDGGQLWVLGLKTEEPGTILRADGGAEVEILGGTILPSFTVGDDTPAFMIADAEASIVIAEHVSDRKLADDAYYRVLIEEEVGDEVLQIRREDLPRRLEGNASVIPLYVSEAATVGRPDGVTPVPLRLNVYPQPAGRHALVEIEGSSGAAELRVYDLLGRRRLQKRRVDSGAPVRLDLTGLAAGFYVIRLNEGDREVHQPLVVLR